MKDPEVIKAKKHLEHLQSLKNDNGTDSNELSDYQKSKVRYKKLIKTKNGSFLCKALSSKKPEEIWDAVNGIINPPKKCIRRNTIDLNNYFTTLASPIVYVISTSIDKKIFPDSWKVTRVCPIPKIDNPITVKNFRPIFINYLFYPKYMKK